MGVRDSVRKALDDAFTDGVKGLYAAALAKVAGGESIDAAMKEFNAGLLLETVKLHARIIDETERTLEAAGLT